MLVSTTVPNLVNGVSQQAENLRFTSQCTEQINGSSSVLSGLSKRPPSKFVNPLSDLPTGDFVVHPINRSLSERFMLVMGSAGIAVTDLSGSPRPVRLSDGVTPVTPADLGYLTTSTPKTSLKALTVADYTILLNTDKTVAKATTVTPALDPSALLFVKQFKLSSNYTMRLFNSPSSSTPSYTYTFSTATTTATQETVAAGLRSMLNADAPADALYNHFHEGPLLYLNKKDGSDFRVEVASDIPEGIAVFKDTAQNFASLPKKGWVGFQLKVSGDPDVAGDDYYVQFVGQDPHATMFSEGTWEESQKFGLRDSLDPLTMPHALVNMGSHFQYKPLTWATRICGDDTSNPAPSFVGRKLRDVFFYKNRLGLLADENTIMSEAGEFFNFWRTTVIQVLDSDPIDVAASHTKVAILNSAIPSSERLLLFSEQTQFLLSSGDLLTPKTVSIAPTSDYENISAVRPQSLGGSVLFPFKRGPYSGFNEYGISGDTNLFTAFDLTEHVPNYLAGLIESFAVCELETTVFAKTDAHADTLFYYRYFKREGQRLQSAWSKWTFDGTIAAFFVLGTTLYLITKRGSAFSLETVELNTGVVDAYSDYVTQLDRRISDVTLSKAYDATGDYTTLTLPYSATDPCVIKRSTAAVAGGSVLPIRSHSGSTVTVHGDHRTTPLWIGENYVMAYTLTRPQMREKRSTGEVVIVPGRFQVGHGMVAYNNTLSFRVEVTPLARETYSDEFSPRILGTTTSITGSPPTPQDGVKRFAVHSKSDQVVIKLINDSPLPCSLLSVDWEGRYKARAQRV